MVRKQQGVFELPKNIVFKRLPSS